MSGCCKGVAYPPKFTSGILKKSHKNSDTRYNNELLSSKRALNSFKMMFASFKKISPQIYIPRPPTVQIRQVYSKEWKLFTESKLHK